METIQQIKEEFLVCPICLNHYRDPKLLPCLHTFCMGCLMEYVQKATTTQDGNENVTGQDNGESVVFKCPVCRTDTEFQLSEDSKEIRSGITDNHLISNLMEKINMHKTEQVCESCSARAGPGQTIAKAEVFCQNCKVSFCESCIEAHNVIKACRDHVVMSLSDIRGNPLQTMKDMKREIPCKEHKEKVLEFYCLDCKVAICSTCVAVTHRRCEMVETCQEIATRMKPEIQNVLSDLDTQERSLTDWEQEHIQEIDELEDNRKTLITEIKSVRKQVDHYLATLEQSAIEEVDAKNANAVFNVKERLQEIEGLKKNLENTNRFLRHLVQYGSDSEFLCVFDRVKQQIIEMNTGINRRKVAKLLFRHKFALDGSLGRLFELKSLGKILDLVDMNKDSFPMNGENGLGPPSPTRRSSIKRTGTFRVEKTPEEQEQELKQRQQQKHPAAGHSPAQKHPAAGHSPVQKQPHHSPGPQRAAEIRQHHNSAGHHQATEIRQHHNSAGHHQATEIRQQQQVQKQQNTLLSVPPHQTSTLNKSPGKTASRGSLSTTSPSTSSDSMSSQENVLDAQAKINRRQQQQQACARLAAGSTGSLPRPKRVQSTIEFRKTQSALQPPPSGRGSKTPPITRRAKSTVTGRPPTDKPVRPERRARTPEGGLLSPGSNRRAAADKVFSPPIARRTEIVPQRSPTTPKPAPIMDKTNAQLLCSFNGRTESDNKKCWPLDVTVLCDGTPVITDFHNKKIKAFDATGDVMCDVLLPSWPHGIANIAVADVAVTLPEISTLVFVTVNEKNMKLQKRIKTVKQYRGICCQNEGIDKPVIVVSCCASNNQSVDILSLDGEIMNSYRHDNRQPGRTLFTWPYYVSVNAQGEIVVSDCETKTGLLYMDNKGDVKYDYLSIGVVIQDPRGICTDLDGNVYLADKSAHAIHSLTADGHYRKCVVSARDDLVQPIALCVSPFGHIIVTQDNGDIKVYAID